MAGARYLAHGPSPAGPVRSAKMSAISALLTDSGHPVHETRIYGPRAASGHMDHQARMGLAKAVKIERTLPPHVLMVS